MYDIVIAGDFFPGRDQEAYNPFSEEMTQFFRESDYVVLNLEAPLTDRGEPISKTGPNLRMNPGFAKVLKESGVDCVCLANNHIRDFGDVGLEDTIKHCQEAGLDIVGGGVNSEEARKPLIKEIGGQKIAFLNHCEREFSIAGKNKAGANPFDTIQVYYDIAALKDKVDKTIVIYHGGLEHQHLPTPEMVKAFRYMIDLGADAIAAHHMHVYSGYEVYKGKPIYYGLGNFFFKINVKNKEGWFKGLTLKLSIGADSITGTCYPTLIKTNMTSVDFVDRSSHGDIDRHMCEINELIQNPELFAKYWEEKYLSIGDKTIRVLLAKSRNHSRLMKVLGVKPRLSPHRLNIFLNTVRCETHRAKLEDILEQRQPEKSDFFHIKSLYSILYVLGKG